MMRLVKIGVLGLLLYAVGSSMMYVRLVGQTGHSWGPPMQMRGEAITFGLWIAGLYAALLVGLSLRRES